jgi:hypothetical protein
VIANSDAGSKPRSEGLTDTTAITERTAQMFPRLTSAQIDRISGNGQRRNARGAGVKRVASAVGEGSICIQMAHRTLREM